MTVALGMFAVSGQTPEVAELNFLLTATQLDTYGVDPHPVKVMSDVRSLSRITQPRVCVTMVLYAEQSLCKSTVNTSFAVEINNC